MDTYVGHVSFVDIAIDPAVLTPKDLNCCVAIITHVMCACMCMTLPACERNRRKSSYSIISGLMLRVTTAARILTCHQGTTASTFIENGKKTACSYV